jgi:hypothetical protein
MRGERQDIITYVFQPPGRFVVPAARFTWWDLDHHELRKVDFPARTFAVATNPALPRPSVASISSKSRNLRVGIGSLGIVAAFIIVLAGFALWISRRKPEWRRPIRIWSPVHLAPLNQVPDRISHCVSPGSGRVGLPPPSQSCSSSYSSFRPFSLATSQTRQPGRVRLRPNRGFPRRISVATSPPCGDPRSPFPRRLAQRRHFRTSTAARQPMRFEALKARAKRF